MYFLPRYTLTLNIPEVFKGGGKVRTVRKYLVGDEWQLTTYWKTTDWKEGSSLVINSGSTYSVLSERLGRGIKYRLGRTVLQNLTLYQT